jgi:hypothetical protein
MVKIKPLNGKKKFYPGACAPGNFNMASPLSVLLLHLSFLTKGTLYESYPWPSMPKVPVPLPSQG